MKSWKMPFINHSQVTANGACEPFVINRPQYTQFVVCKGIWHRIGIVIFNTFKYCCHKPCTGWPKKWELLKCVVAAIYSWQHCWTGTLSYRQPRHLVIMDQWNGQQRAVAIKKFYMFGFFKSSHFLGHPYISLKNFMSFFLASCLCS
jgi:hypothetical protein